MYKKGEKMACPCPKCNMVTTGTLKEMTYKNRGIVVPKVLRLVCDTCGTIAGSPAQSTRRIHEHIKNKI